VLSLNLNRQIRCIAIDPLYSKGGFNRRFMIGKFLKLCDLIEFADNFLIFSD